MIVYSTFITFKIKFSIAIMRIVITTVALLFSLAVFSQPVEHVIIIGVDGMSPDGIRKADTPIMDNLMENGAFTLHARNVLPTSSSPNWASMIMGAGPEQHGITSNEWQPDDHELPPVVRNEAGIFPTIFWLIHNNDPDAELGAIYHWADFGRLFEKSAVDHDVTYKNENRIVDESVEYITEKKPKFLFIHIDFVDGVGHKFGHGTKQYYQSVWRADQLIGRILEAVKAAEIHEKTMIIVSADHGGKGTGHGGESLGEVEIPVLLSGVAIKKGVELSDPVNIYDIASTVADIFGYEQPKAWIGRPISEAYE